MESTNPTVGSPSCTYTTLSQYNMGAKAQMRPQDTSGYYVVPAYGVAGYNTLMHDAAPSCSGYFNIGDAYRSKDGSCNQQYVRKLCQ